MSKTGFCLSFDKASKTRSVDHRTGQELSITEYAFSSLSHPEKLECVDKSKINSLKTDLFSILHWNL